MSGPESASADTDSEHDGIFVVGTGRCGSTLLTQMLRLHPDRLSLSEFFAFITDLGNLIPRAFPSEPVDGDTFWSVVAGVHPRQNLLLRHGLRMAEVRYPFERGRFRPETGVPALALTTLPHLDEDPDARLDELESVIRAWPRAPMASHYLALFAWLTRRYQKRGWVERSGGTLRIVHRFMDTFPRARFVHIVRDGRNTAISMSRHIGFRMALVAFQIIEFLGVDPFEDDDRSELDDLPDDLVALLPETFTARAFWDYDLSPALCGHYWSGEIVRGLEALAALPQERLLTLRYEELIARPRQVLARLEAFMGERADPGWIADAAALAGEGRSSWHELPLRAQRELEEACQPGFEALGKQGLRWD